jgi:DNA-binding transcriptional ArsR family regulator
MVGPLSENKFRVAAFFLEWRNAFIRRFIPKISEVFSPMGEWKFVTNHALVLAYLAKHHRITARELATSIGITERAVRKIIADLEAERYISKEKEGRRVRYFTNSKLPLRHQTQQDKSIGKLLGVLGLEEKKK